MTVATPTAPRCAWCGGRLDRLLDGWIEIHSPLSERTERICQPCWTGAEHERIVEALGLAMEAKR